jgi:hypothetical protein
METERVVVLASLNLLRKALHLAAVAAGGVHGAVSSGGSLGACCSLTDGTRRALSSLVGAGKQLLSQVPGFRCGWYRNIISAKRPLHGGMIRWNGEVGRQGWEANCPNKRPHDENMHQAKSHLRAERRWKNGRPQRVHSSLYVGRTTYSRRPTDSRSYASRPPSQLHRRRQNLGYILPNGVHVQGPFLPADP